MAVAVFNYAAWSALYPTLATSVNEALAASLFAQAGLYLDNTDASPVMDANARLALFNMLVAHLAIIGGYVAGTAQAEGLVGRVQRAQEGSVSVETADLPGTDAWYAQTEPGFSFWQATRIYRTARYYPAAQPVFDPIPFGRRWLM